MSSEAPDVEYEICLYDIEDTQLTSQMEVLLYILPTLFACRERV